jgi:hypothetical protein
MEITLGVLEKFYVAKIIVLPPLLPHKHVMDVKIFFASKEIPVSIEGHANVTINGDDYDPRTYATTVGASISSLARKHFRRRIQQLTEQIFLQLSEDLDIDKYIVK